MKTTLEYTNEDSVYELSKLKSKYEEEELSYKSKSKMEHEQ